MSKITEPRNKFRKEQNGQLSEIQKSILSDAKLEFISALHWHCHSDWELKKRSLDHCMIYYILDGKGKFQCDSTKGDWGHDSFLLYPPYLNQSMQQSLPTEGFDCLCIHFSWKLHGGICAAEQLRLPISLTLKDNGNEIKNMIYRLTYEFGNKEFHWQENCNNLLDVILKLLIRWNVENFGTALTTRQLQQKNRLAKVFQYIEEHFLEKIQIAELAELVFLSEVQFRSIFKQVTNLSPALYIQRKRLSTAAEMLMNTDKPITDVIEETGFHNSALFFRSFKKQFGITPYNYRNSEI